MALTFGEQNQKGYFTIRRGLEDDVKARVKVDVQPFTVLDRSLVLWRVAEVIGTGLAFASGNGLYNAAYSTLALSSDGRS